MDCVYFSFVQCVDVGVGVVTMDVNNNNSNNKTKKNPTHQANQRAMVCNVDTDGLR